MKELMMNIDYFDLCGAVHQRGEGLYDEDKIRSLLKKCKANGFSAVMWRTSVCGKVAYRSKVMTVFDAEYRLSCNSLARVMEKIDPLEIAVKEAHKLGLKIYAWVTLFDSYYPGLEDAFFAKNPHLLMVSRDGNSVLRGIGCLACPETVDYRLREAKEVSGYGVDGIFFSLGTHTICTRAAGDKSGEDVFGFNPEVVKEFKEKYGRDIINEDYDKEAFYRLHGEYLTRFLKLVKNSLPPGQQLYVLSGCPGPGRDDKPLRDGEFWEPYGYSKGIEPVPYWFQVSLYLDQKRWATENIVDGIVMQTDEPNEIAKLRRACGNKLKYFIWCHCSFEKEQEKERMPVLKKLLETMESVGADGITFHEAANFEYGDSADTLWKMVQP